MRQLFIASLLLLLPALYGQQPTLQQTRGAATVQSPTGATNLNNEYFATTDIASTFAAAGTTGTVVIPRANTQTGIFANPNNISYQDWRMGSIGAPTRNLSFAGNNFFLFNADASPQTNDTCCGGQGPAGVGNAAPMVHFHLYETGNANALPFYSQSEWAAGATGFQIGYDLATTADSGSLPKQVSGVFITADNSGWTINSCTLTSGIDLCTVTTTIPSNIATALVGTGVYVSGNSIANTGAATGVVRSATANSITFSNANQTGSGGPVSGGHIGPNHLAWGSELNVFNNNHDPGPTTPVSGQNVYPFHGWTVTSTGNYPTSEGFYSSGINTYAGFRSDGAITADFIAGTPISGSGSTGTIGFLARPTQVAVSGTNYSSKAIKLTSSVWNGRTYTESSTLLSRKPASNSTGAAGVVELDMPTTDFQWTDAGQLLSPAGTPSLPTYSFAADPTSGFYRNKDGTVRLTVAGSDQIKIGAGVVIPSLAGTGDALLCVHSDGTLFRGTATTCP